MSNQVQTERAAASVEQCKRELDQRLAELHAAHPMRKIEKAPFVLAAFLELLQYQARFNQCAIGELYELRSKVELLASSAGVSFVVTTPGITH